MYMYIHMMYMMYNNYIHVTVGTMYSGVLIPTSKGLFLGEGAKGRSTERQSRQRDRETDRESYSWERNEASPMKQYQKSSFPVTTLTTG